MGTVLIAAGVAGLIVTAVAAPIAVAVLRRQAQALDRQIQQDYEFSSGDMLQ